MSQRKKLGNSAEHVELLRRNEYAIEILEHHDEELLPLNQRLLNKQKIF